MLHIPVRMSISSIVCPPRGPPPLSLFRPFISLTCCLQILAKILRTTDSKALEADNVIDSSIDNGGERRGANKEEKRGAQGRSQVMNLLTIDTNTVASLATHTWSFANGVTTCTSYVFLSHLSPPIPLLPILTSFPFLHFSHLLCLSVYLNPSKSAKQYKV